MQAFFIKLRLVQCPVFTADPENSLLKKIMSGRCWLDNECSGARTASVHAVV